MTAEQTTRYLRARAERVLSASAHDYPEVARQLAAGVLELLEARDIGAGLERDRVFAEMAELRDELHGIDAAAAMRCLQLEQRIATLADAGETALNFNLLEQRVNAVALQLEQLGDDHRETRRQTDHLHVALAGVEQDVRNVEADVAAIPTTS